MLKLYVSVVFDKPFAKQQEARRVIEESNNFLEILLEKALTETRQISITLKSRKVYVGLVTSNFDPSYDRKFLTIIPLLSGYRETEDQSLIITTDYSYIYQKMIINKEEFQDITPSDFEIVIPISEIQSVNIFNSNAYSLFNMPTFTTES